MQDKLFNIKKIVALILFIAVFSLMGLSTGKPVMVLAYAVFFLAVSFAVVVLIRKRQRHFEVSVSTNPLFAKIGGAIMIISSLLIPLYVIKSTTLLNTGKEINAMFLFAVLGVVILFMGLLYVAVKLINKAEATVVHRAMGYALIVIASIIPGAIVAGLDRSTTGIGSTYYLALTIVILSWNGWGLISNQE